MLKDVWQLMLSRWAHIHVPKARAVGKRDVIPFRNDEALSNALPLWRVMDLSAGSPNLSGRVGVVCPSS
jgi:hypothetical protein